LCPARMCRSDLRRQRSPTSHSVVLRFAEKDGAHLPQGSGYRTRPGRLCTPPVAPLFSSGL